MFEVLDQSRSSGSDVVHKVAQHDFLMPRIESEADQDLEPVLRFKLAVEAVDSAFGLINEIAQDPRLSDHGKRERLDPVHEKAIVSLAEHARALDQFETYVNDREAKLLAVPALGQANAADAIIDRELRDWWRSLPSEVKARALGDMLSKPGFERLQTALLRSPYAQLDRDVQAAREGWNAARRRDNPEESEAIASRRAMLDWGRRGLGQVIGIAKARLRWSDDRVLQAISKDETALAGGGAFGFDQRQIANKRAHLEAQRRLDASRGTGR